MNTPDTVTYFGETDSRNKRIRFGIKAKDRTKHVYVIGKTGMGKSTLLENMAIQDIQQGNGFAFMDPHGSTADLLLEYIPEERKKDVLYFAPFDAEHPVGFNIMEDVGFGKRHLVVSGIMSTFKKIWVDAWSARMEYILSNTLLALLEYPGSTLLSVNKMLADKKFRADVIYHITDPAVKAFWVDEFGSWTDRYIQEAVPAIQNKIGQFTGNPIIRNIIGQPKSSFDLREMMDENKIIIVNLSKGQIGEVNANLLGSMLITKIYLAAMSRADKSGAELEKLPNFYLYVDEFQSFSNDSFADILSEARKYKLNLTIAHQYIEQMEDIVRAAVFGNVGTMITFRVGSYDADVLEKEFAPVFLAEDIVNLGKFQIYLKLMIDGIGSKPFSAATMAPINKPDSNDKHAVIESSREIYGRNKDEVEKVASDFLQQSQTKEKDNQGDNKNQRRPNNQGGRQDSKRETNKRQPETQRSNSESPIKHEQKLREQSPREQGLREERGNQTNQVNAEEKTVQPFKNVFSDATFKSGLIKNAQEQLRKERNESRSDEVSLKNLVSKRDKGPSDRHKNDLREALRSVLGTLPAESAKSSEQPKPRKSVRPVDKQNHAEPKKPQKEREDQPEIPKKQEKQGISDDVLKDLLKITADDL